MSKPFAVATGDVHFTPATLELATAVFNQMHQRAVELGVPLVLNGDTTDTKAIIRAEVANRLISLISASKVPVIVNVGNHDLLSEKSKEHAIHFLKPYCQVVDAWTYVDKLGAYMVPYYGDSEELESTLNVIPDNSTVLVHQGVQSAFLGHYTQDKTSLPPSAYGRFRTFGSHYHRRQDIKCGRPRKGAVGLFSYLGSPYSQSFGEASDGEKGFSILYDDGSLELVPTNLRKHVVVETNVFELDNYKFSLDSSDLLWLKVKGSTAELAKLNKAEIGKRLLGHSNFKFDKIYADAPVLEQSNEKLTEMETLYSLIDATDESKLQKNTLKHLATEMLNEAD